MLYKSIRPQKLFFLLLLIYFVIGVLFISLNSHADSFLLSNIFHRRYLDIFFTNYTLLGDGIFSIALFLVLVLSERLTLAIQVILSYLFSGICVQLLKQLIAAPRPKVFFSEASYAYFFEGLTRSGFSSFPSGHTASAFALATLLSLHTDKRYLAVLYFSFAIVIGYSRVYLGQHFPKDVLAGSFMGVFCALFIHWLVKEVKISWANSNRDRFRISIH
jgi:membrane-associated phospholipid phosphatase